MYKTFRANDNEIKDRQTDEIHSLGHTHLSMYRKNRALGEN